MLKIRESCDCLIFMMGIPYLERLGPVCGILGELISPLCRIYASVNRVGIGSDNGLSPIRRQAIIYTNAVVLSIGPLRTISSDFLLKIHFSFTKIHVKISFAKWRLSYSGWEELISRIPFISFTRTSGYAASAPAGIWESGVSMIVNLFEKLFHLMTWDETPDVSNNTKIIMSAIILVRTDTLEIYRWEW